MRELNIGTKRYTKVVCLDEPGAGGACHEYEVQNLEGSIRYSKVSFQKGPVQEEGVNGCHQEDLIAIVIDRLRGFQSGEYACYENARALANLEEALDALRARTNERIERGVEGTHQV